MESDAGKRERGNSVVGTNGHPNPTTNNDGSMSTPQVGDSRSQNTIEIHIEETGYDIDGQKNKSSAGNPSPRNQHYAPSTLDRHARSSPKDQSLAAEPPVTKGTLSELDVNKIVNNPKLRHDINFDPDLHFRPNLDGEKGRRKTEKANNFWETMQTQLQCYLTDREQFEKELGDAEWCLPATLKAIRGILETLVPQRDRASVEETFNVDLLMQQFRKGVADLGKLALWLSRLLKCHCAPMRDNWVDEMVTQLSDGDRNYDVGLLVAGMKNLLGVLEAMKLDVANHQIRCLRPLLIEDTVHFEQKFFMKKIAMGRVDIAGAHAWFRRASALPDIPDLDVSTHTQGNTWDFIKALVNLTLPSKSELFPHTFLFDEERLIKLRSDMLDLINLEICMQLYRNLESQSRSQEVRYTAPDDTPIQSFVSSPCDRPASPADNTMLSSPTVPLPHHFAKQNLAQERGHFIRHPSGRQIWVPKVDEGLTVSATSSPRSSPSSTASTPDTLPPTPLYLSLPSSDSASQVRSSLLAILSSSTTNDKWTSLSSALALQILRSTTTPLTRLPQFESHLAFHLSNSRSRVYQEAEERVLSQMFPVLQKLIDNYTPLTSLQIFEAATTPRNGPPAISQANGLKEETTEISTRIAHIGILHWRVWAPLAYLVDPDADDDTNQGIP
ncbi:Tcp11-domain-containing protein [Acephala macrosclerotiorum]|nr:Tcp11-domain-containing protein [Acephala macrosclerotiorum]